MNVLFLATDVFKKGGIQRYTRYQVRALKEFVENLFLFSLLGKDPQTSLEGEYEIDYVAGGVHVWQKLRFALMALFFVRRKKIDLVWCNHVALTPVANLIKKLFGTPYVVNVYGLEIWGGLHASEISGLKNADAVIGDCRFVLEYIKNELFVKVKKPFLLYDCVDLERFKPVPVAENIYTAYGIPRGKKIIGTIGRLDRDKGHGSIISALKDIPDAYYLIVGDGIKRADLEGRADDEGVRERVIFTGRVPEEDLVPLYNIPDVVALISRFGRGEGEGLPLGLIEAMACAKPIIAGNEDGSREAVIEGENGFIVQPLQTTQIAEKLGYMVGNDARVKEMGERAKDMVQEKFSYKTFQNRMEEILGFIENEHGAK